MKQGTPLSPPAPIGGAGVASMGDGETVAEGAAARPICQARTGTGKCSILFCSADYDQDIFISLFSWSPAGLATLQGLSIICYM